MKGVLHACSLMGNLYVADRTDSVGWEYIESIIYRGVVFPGNCLCNQKQINL